MAKSWHNKHIPTKIGVSILAILLLGLIVLTLNLNQIQSLSSHAALLDRQSVSYGSCTANVYGKTVQGTCLDRGILKTNAGYFNSGRCPNLPSNIQCFITGPVPCKVGSSPGTCQNRYGDNARSCSGTYYPSHCPGPADVQCCVLKTTSASRNSAPSSNNQSNSFQSAPKPQTVYSQPQPQTQTPGTGLSGYYFTDGNGKLTDFYIKQTDPMIDFSWGLAGVSGDNHVPRDMNTNKGNDTNFSVRWKGKLVAPYTGSYTLYITSEDGVRLYINGVKKIDKWHDGNNTYSTSVALVKDVPVSIQIEYYNDYEVAPQIHLSWSLYALDHTIQKQIIPTTQLYPN